ncbi:MAG: DUF1295 domain-containing protein [Leptospira sp.]|nr:DUF1295 domain-containing protein [Leptospira sp.]
MNLIHFPHLTDVVLYTYAFYIFLAIVAFKLESSGSFNLPYSKFAKASGINPRIGMFIIYFLPILAYLSTWGELSEKASFYHYLLLAMFVFHFGKRCLEVLFLHQFSGKIGTVAVVFITFAYSNIGFLSGSLHNRATTEITNQIPMIWMIFGFVLFMVGEVGNLYHHILLRKLRTSSEDKSYKIPSDGLFKILVCPHYFFELLAWLSFAFVSTYIDVYFVFIIMAAYLTGRSKKTKEWYITKVPGFPLERKRIFPFLY